MRSWISRQLSFVIVSFATAHQSNWDVNHPGASQELRSRDCKLCHPCHYCSINIVFKPSNPFAPVGAKGRVFPEKLTTGQLWLGGGMKNKKRCNLRILKPFWYPPFFWVTWNYVAIMSDLYDMYCELAWPNTANIVVFDVSCKEGQKQCK